MEQNTSNTQESVKPKKNSSAWPTVQVIIGGFFIVGFIGNLTSGDPLLASGSGAEVIGFNVWQIGSPILGLWLVYIGYKGFRK